MPEGDAPADAGQQAGAEAPPAPPADAGTQQGSDDSAAVIARVNAEARDWRKKYEQAQAAIEEHEQAKMSETERLQSKLSDEEGRRIELERRVQELTLAQAVRAAAVKAGAVDPDLVWRAIELSSVEFDDGGQPKNLDKIIGELKGKHPVLFSATQGDADGGARGGGGPGTVDMNELIRRGAQRGT